MKRLTMRPIFLASILAASILVAACLPASIATPVPAATPQSSVESTPVAASRTSKKNAGPPLMTIDRSAKYSATIKTNRGDIVLELFTSAAPITVNNFVFLANEGFYNGIIFHRVIPNFMIQGGDPTGTGTSGPGYKFEDEFDPTLVFDRPGILAMANSGPNTNGSQFFITVVPTPHLNGAHTIFGRVLEGQEVADTISEVAKGPGGKPVEPVIIEGIEITKSSGP